jgi:hypothetical protein
MNLLFTFKKFSDVFSCEKIIKAAGLSCRVVPVPRSLGVTCEYAAEIRNIEAPGVYRVLALLKEEGLQYTRIFHSIPTENGEVY